jgi:AraC-like DNA-binding protein
MAFTCLAEESEHQIWLVTASKYKKVAIERIRRTILSLGYFREHQKKEEMSLTPMLILGILIIYQALIFIVSMLLNKKAKPLFLKLLMIIFLTIILHFGYMLLQFEGIMQKLLLGPFFGLVYGPLYYFYTKSLIVESWKLDRMFLHFIPAFAVLVLILFAGDLLTNRVDLSGLLISLHFMSYLLLALRLIYSYRTRLLNTASSFYRISLYWLEGIIYLQLATLALALLESYFQSLMNTNTFILIIYVFTLVLIHCFYYLGLKQVRLFRGFREERSGQGGIKEYTIPEDSFDEYLDKLNRYIEREQPYLDYDITLQELSDRLGISTRNLSHVINKHFKKNYYGFINQYRLQHAMEHLKTSEGSIKEIMYDSGFSNKATFYSLFKKETGLTPVQFRNRRKI